MPAHYQRQNNQRYAPPAGPDAITAPYNFVPLSPDVFQPEWSDEISIDEPLADGLCGTLDFDITAYSPLLIGEKLQDGGPVHPYRLPDGEYAIPGSTLRGMVRNVLEIAAFGKMQLVDDKRYGVRDLTPGARPFYGSKLTTTAGRQQFKTQSKAGWLQFVNGEWQIMPCDFARIEHHELKQFLGGKWVRISKKERPDAEKKYKFWQEAGQSLQIKFDAGSAAFQSHSQGKQLFYRKASALGRGQLDGTLIFTGQPGPDKHLEFIFFNENAAQSKLVPERVMQGFLQIYKETDHWKALRNMKAAFGHGIPVFYLEEGGDISSVGLSLMYKLAYRNSVGEVIKNTQNALERFTVDDVEYDKPYLAELIFGFVDELDGKQSLKSRVSFAHAQCQQSPDQVKTRQHTTILNGPKPTYYPNYIEQKQENGVLKGDGYATFMDKDARIRGWKRYPVRPDSQVPIMSRDQAENKKIQVELHPLVPDPELVFKSRLRFHNLKPVELGALLWAMEWGGDTSLRHNVGMGKAFGFGRVAISVDPVKTGDILPNDFSEPGSLKSYRDQFVAEMGAFCCEQGIRLGWQNSAQLVQLMAMANPDNAPGQPGGLEHLDLAGGGRNNEFVLAKKAKLVLQSYAAVSEADGSASGSLWDDSPAGQWLKTTVAEIAEATRTPEEKVMPAKGLAKEWSAINDAALKADVLALIQDYWVRQDWWDDPRGKSMKVAHTIYSGN